MEQAFKSARIVGDVIGKYHPHGDQSVYDALVRMAQPFSMRYQLVDGQGNFGSVDGDSAAAMRYTEVRMKKLTNMLLADIEKRAVDFGANYDGTLDEPLVFPARFPNLLVNGSEGIAVGMATRIPPHNLTVITATLHRIDHPECDRRFDCSRAGARFPHGRNPLRVRVALKQLTGRVEGSFGFGQRPTSKRWEMIVGGS